MWWRRGVSDAEFVDGLQRNVRWRRPIALICLAVAVSMGACTTYLVHLLQTGEMLLRDDPFEQLWFEQGARTGFVGGVVMAFTFFYFVSSVHLFFPDRREQLLLAYHRRLAELNELPPAT